MTGPKFLSNGPASCPPKIAVGRAGCLRYRAQDIGASPYLNRGKTIVFRIRVVPRTISPLHKEWNGSFYFSAPVARKTA